MAVDLPTPDELARAAQAAIAAKLDPDGTGAVNLHPGSRLDVAVSVSSALGTRVAEYAAARFAATRLAGAEGTDLDDLARDRYGESRKAEAHATGTLRLARAGATATSIPKGSRLGVPATSTAPAVVFETTEDVASSATIATLPVRCVTAGPTGNITGGAAVTAILDPLPDATWALDTAYMGANPSQFVFGGGALEESDDALRARLAQLDPETSRRRGTRAAIVAGALRTPGVAFATAIEPLDGSVVLYAGDSNYALPAALKAAIEGELLEWRAFGVPALVRAYNAQTVTVAMTVYMARALAHYDVAAVKAAAAAAVSAYFEGRPQPDEFYLNAIEACGFRAHDEVQQVVLAAPLANVQRPADTGYGAVTALNRYRVTDASVQITIAAPLTA